MEESRDSSFLLRIQCCSNLSKNKYGYDVLGEIFIKNKYGANVAQTEKTSDYYQADEHWWQAAKQNGIYVGDIDYDKSAGVYSLAICVRITDRRGNFAGVMKAVLNIEEVIRTLESSREYWARENERFESRQMYLITGDGRMIYSTGKYKFLETAPDPVLYRIESEKNPSFSHYFVTEDSKNNLKASSSIHKRWRS